MKQNTYYFKNISTDSLEPIQKRPGMYIGTLDNKGVFEMLFLLFEEATINAKSKIYLMLEANSFHLKLENIDLKLVEAPPKLPFAFRKGDT